MKYRSGFDSKAFPEIGVSRHRFRLSAGTISAALLCTLLHSHAHGAFEDPPTLQAADLYPPDWLRGSHYYIQPQVPTDGFLTRVTIKSDYGTFQARGPGILGVRLREITALAELDRLEQGGEFVSGVADSAGDTGSNLKQLAEEPGGTLAGIPKGIQRFFQRSLRTAKTARHKQQGADAEEDGIASDLPGDGPDENILESPDSGAPRGQGSVTAARALGFDDARRELAKRLGVDPYTTNTVLAKRLDEVAWAAFAGQLSLRVAAFFIPGGFILSTSNQVADLVWDTPPGDLQLEIERKLLDMGIKQADVDRFLSHRWYSLSMQTAAVWALDRMDGVAGRAGVMSLLLEVDSETQARFVVQSLMMTSRAHRMMGPLKQLDVEWTLMARTHTGERLVAVPADYLSWNPRIERFISGQRFDPGRRSLHLAGLVTAFTRLKLEQHGWEVVENSNLYVPILGYSKAPAGPEAN